ncbi:NADP-binding protein, partial [Pseudomonadota bacterium]
MGEPIRLLILGTGQMGSGIARLSLDKPNLKLVGAYARRSDRAGTDLGPAIGLDRDLGLTIGNDLSEIIQATRPDVAIQATCSTLIEAKAEIATLIEHGVNVISIAEEMAFPACVSPEIAEQLNALAVKHGVSVLGTGINPGFVLDTLIIALSGICQDITSITATRINDLSPYGPTVLSSQGVGLTVDEFNQGIQDLSVIGHVGFEQSI